MDLQYILWIKKVAIMLQTSSTLFSLLFFTFLVGIAMFGEGEDMPLAKHKKKIFGALVVCVLVMYLVPPESYFDVLIEQAVENK